MVPSPTLIEAISVAVAARVSEVRIGSRWAPTHPAATAAGTAVYFAPGIFRLGALCTFDLDKTEHH